MEDMGDIIGALMVGMIRARRIADEETAALAEYYRDNPLLEGLSVPRVRIPELTIDLPVVLEDQISGEAGTMNNPTAIANAARAQIKASLIREGTTVSPAFNKALQAELDVQLAGIKQSSQPVMKETVARASDVAFANALRKSKLDVSPIARKNAARDLRTKVSAVGLSAPSVSPSVKANVRTADVKEKASSANVVRLKITMKEEGLEWANQATDSGGIKSTLQPE